ncbi:MAG: flippase [Nitrospirae bacterium]|nr:flippase [Nitrospirota bacterium]
MIGKLLVILKKSNRKKDVEISFALFKRASGIFVIRIISIVLSFVTSIILARLLGVVDYGIFTYSFAWVSVLMMVSIMGFDKLLLRYVSTYHAKFKWELIYGIVRRTYVIAIVVSIILMFLVAIIALVVQKSHDLNVLSSFLLSLLLLPIFTLIRLHQSTLQGLHRIMSGQVPEMIIQPILFILFILITFFIINKKLSAPLAIIEFIIASILILIALRYMLKKSISQYIKDITPIYEMKLWLKSSLPLLIFNSLYVINAWADVIMLGLLKGTEFAGVYNIANRGAEFITFILVSVNTVFAPTIARLYTTGQIEELQYAVTSTARIILIFSIPIAFVLIFFGKFFLMLYGNEFLSANLALKILSVAQFFNVATGSVGYLLIMTGHEKDAATGIGISAIINIFLNAILIPSWGIEGAAIATASSIIVWNILLAIWVYRRLKIHTTAFGIIKLWKRD